MSGNVCGLFFKAAARHSDTVALAILKGDSEIVVAFGELRDRVERFAGGLASAGFGRGSRAIVMVPMSIDLYTALLGVLSVGGTAMFVDPWIGIRRIASVAAASAPDAFIGVPKAHLMRLLHRALGTIPLTISTASPWAGMVAHESFESLRGAVAFSDAEPDAVALITYTTGSSGAPKGVVRTHATLAAQHEAIRDEFPAFEGDVDLTTFPVR
ncbi:MAG: AMP-binding protein [Acidobacteria bacterium]|nr:AMP-binding protein [Acidobacteriota bacterium]